MLAPPAPKCSGMQAFAVLVTGTELLLLLVVFWATARRNDAFVSTEMQAAGSPLRVLLTIFVVATAAVCLAYVYVRTGRAPRFGWALLGAGTSLGGWAALALTDMQTPGHVAGTLLFALGTGAYVLVMLAVTNAPKAVYLAGYTAVAVFAVLFAALDYTQYKGAAALFEWTALTTHAATLLMFFISHPFERGHKALVELRTLLGSLAA